MHVRPPLLCATRSTTDQARTMTTNRTKPGTPQGGRIAVASAGANDGATVVAGAEGVRLVEYEDETQLSDIMSLVDRDLSEPYSIFTYRYFLHNWPGLCFVVRVRGNANLVLVN